MHQFKRWVVGLGLVALILGGCGDDQEDTKKPQALDVSKLNVISTQEIDLVAGPGSTSAFLAPDGQHFAHWLGQEICLYTVAGEKGLCVSLEDAPFHLDPESTFWSPDSRYLLLGTNFFRSMSDPDIWVADMSSGTLANLTEDGFDGSTLDEAPETAFIDLGTTWIEGGKRIVFLRYSYNRDLATTPTVMTIKPDGSDLKEIGTIQASEIFAIGALVQSPDRKSWAFNYSQHDTNDPDQGAWIADAKFQKPRQIGAFEYHAGEGKTMISTPWWITFSPDGQYLMTYSDEVLNQSGPGPVVSGDQPHLDPLASPIQIFAVKDGQPFLADRQYFVRGGAWAPSGHAFAYIVNDHLLDEGNGLYLSAGPGQPGRLVLAGRFFPPTSINRHPLTWAGNHTILMSNFGDFKLIVVQLGEGESIPFAADEETPVSDS